MYIILSAKNLTQTRGSFERIYYKSVKTFRDIYAEHVGLKDVR